MAEYIISIEVLLLCFKSLTIQKELMDEVSEPFWVSLIQTCFILFMRQYTLFFVFELMCVLSCQTTGMLMFVGPCIILITEE